MFYKRFNDHTPNVKLTYLLFDYIQDIYISPNIIIIIIINIIDFQFLFWWHSIYGHLFFL